jgi:large repetitive protein
MSVSKLLPAGGANDFNIALGGTYTSITFTKEYAAGGYSIVSASGDTTLDIYAFNADGSIAAYTSTKSMTATKGFSKMVILGGASGDLLSFTFKLTYVSTNETAETSAGPVAASVSPSSLPNINDSTTITGRNFNAAMTATFTGTDAVVRNAKSITVGSATSAIIVRPDDFPTTVDPYTITLSNSAAGVNDPVGSSANILASSITAGESPVWSTSATLPAYQQGYAYSTTLVATDSSDPGSTMSYAVNSGTLPNGLSLAGSTGVISGTPTVSSTSTVTVRATDSGGNYVDRAFTLSDSAPIWSSPAAGALSSGVINTAYTSVTFVAYDTNGASTTTAGITYSVASGSIPSGMTLNSSTGVFSGTPTSAGDVSFTVRATDSGSKTADRSFTMTIGLGSMNNISVASGGTHTDLTSTAQYATGAGAAATAISLNSALICGGTNGVGSGAPSSSAYVYTISSNTWTQKANMPAIRSGHGIAAVGTTVYVWGGNPNSMSDNYWGGSVESRSAGIGQSTTSTMWAYSISGNSWTTKTAMPVSTMQSNGAASGTKIYAFGRDAGADAGSAGSRDIYIYDTVADSWSTLTNQFADFSSGSTSWVTSNKTGMIYGWAGHFGASQNAQANATSRFYSFTPSTNTLTLITSGVNTQNSQWPSTNSHLGTAWFPGNGNNGYAFFMGGQAGSDNYTRFYDISAGTWSSGNSPSANSGSISTMINSNFYANNCYNMTSYAPGSTTSTAVFFGGYGNSTEKFTPATGTGTSDILATTYAS